MAEWWWCWRHDQEDDSGQQLFALCLCCLLQKPTAICRRAVCRRLAGLVRYGLSHGPPAQTGLCAHLMPAGQSRQPLEAHTAAGLLTMKTPMYLYSVNRKEVAPSLMAA